MATALGRRGPDDRRAPLLAAPEAGRERGGAEIPAHRAGSRRQVRGTGLRAALARVSVAVTAIVVLAFLIPLALVVQHLARERAMADAERQTAVVVAVLAVTTDPVAVARAIATSDLVNAPTGSRVHGLATGAIGTTHARADEVRLTAGQRRARPSYRCRGASLPRAGRPRLGGAIAVGRGLRPRRRPDPRGRQRLVALGIVAVFLLVVSVLASDRLAAQVVESARGLAAAARSLGEGDLEVTGAHQTDRGNWPRPARPSTPWPTASPSCARPSASSSPTCRTGCAPR